MTVLPQLSTFLRYGLATGAVLIALLLTMALPPLFEGGVFLLFLVAIVIVALYRGLGPGMLTILLSISAINGRFSASHLQSHTGKGRPLAGARGNADVPPE